MSEPMIWLLVRGVWETLAMTFCSWPAGRRAAVRHPSRANCR